MGESIREKFVQFVSAPCFGFRISAFQYFSFSAFQLFSFLNDFLTKRQNPQVSG